jgi:hypothetical protein
MNMIETVKPWVLVVGRKRRVMKESARLEMKQETEAVYSWNSVVPVAIVPTSQTIQLFIGGKLFSTAIITPKRPYSRFALKVVKPKRGRMEIHLTKKLNKFEAVGND